MKIIDSNKDFYDYYQGILPDDVFTFDRRDSYNLSKEEFASYFTAPATIKFAYNPYSDIKFILLQVCNTFWLFALKGKSNNGAVLTNYDIKLLKTWKNYNLKKELIKLSNITFNYGLFSWDEVNKLKYENITEKQIKNMMNAVDRNEFKTLRIFNKFYIIKGDSKIEKHIPILKNIGIASLINPEDIYLSLEEYFSTEKTESERTESVGLTNKDKIINHGFDIKTSFRGK